MSNKKHSDPLIKNEDTLRRRAWIEQALAGVRMQSGISAGSFAVGEKPQKPDLYLVDRVRDA